MSIDHNLILKLKKAIGIYVKKNLKSVSLPQTRLLEIIVIPNYYFYLIARLNVLNVKSVCDPRLNELAKIAAPLLKKGIFCIFRPANFSTTDVDINKIVSRFPCQKIRRKVKLPEKISDLIKKCGKKLKDKKIWEVEFSQNKKIVIRLFGKRYKTVKRNGIIYEFIPESQKEIAKKLMQITFYCVNKKINLLTYLFCRKQF